MTSPSRIHRRKFGRPATVEVPEPASSCRPNDAITSDVIIIINSGNDKQLNDVGHVVVGPGPVRRLFPAVRQRHVTQVVQTSGSGVVERK